MAEEPRGTVRMPDPDLPVGVTIGTIPAADGTKRLMFVFQMPGMTVAVPLSGAAWDSMRKTVDKLRPTLDLVIGTPGIPLESNGNGGLRIG